MFAVMIVRLLYPSTKITIDVEHSPASNYLTCTLLVDLSLAACQCRTVGSYALNSTFCC